MYAEDGPTVCAFGDIGPKHRVGEEHSYSKLLRWNIRARTFTPPHPWPGRSEGEIMAANGHTRVLKPGIFAPIPTFFQPETEDLGTQTSRHLSRFASTNMLISERIRFRVLRITNLTCGQSRGCPSRSRVPGRGSPSQPC